MNLSVSNAICEYVENLLQLPFTIYSDILPEADQDGACIRHDPAPAAEARYIDGSRLISWNLSFYVRCKNAAQARVYAKIITDLLDGAEIDADGVLVSCEAATLPQYISTDEKGFTVYSAAITSEYMETN